MAKSIAFAAEASRRAALLLSYFYIPARMSASRTASHFKSTHWVVDLELHTAVRLTLFAVRLTLFAGVDPDSHMFRLLDGKIVKVHTLTQGTGK